MRALFVHDHIFLTDGSNFYSDKLTYDGWGRYLKHCDTLSVFSRAKTIVAGSSSMPLSSGVSVDFISGESISSFRAILKRKRGFVKRKLLLSIQCSDFIIVRLPSEFGLLAVALAKREGKPFVVEVVGCARDALWYYGGVTAKIYSLLAFFRTRQAVRLASHVVYVSQKYLQDLYPGSKDAICASISNVNLSGFSPRCIFARQLKIKSQKSIIRLGLIGSLKTRYKGIHTAIEAISILRQQGFFYELQVLGGGDSAGYMSYARHLNVSDSVTFCGLLSPGVEVFEWLDSIDIYIQPSFTEGVPRALIEAMSRGCPAVGSSAGGIPELLDGEFIFKAGDANALASRIIALRDENIALRQAVRNYELAKLYSYDLLEDKRDTFFKGFKRFYGLLK